MRMIFGLAIGLVLSSGVAQAASTGFTLLISGNANVPTFSLTNDSVSATLTKFTFTIGRSDRNFDSVDLAANQPAGGSAVANGIDANTSGGLRTDVIDIDFTGFDPGESVSWTSDIDQDPTSNVTRDFRNTFFNNGAFDNSVAMAMFSNGESASLTLPDTTSGPYSYSAMGAASAAVPVPAALPLMVSALGLASLVARRRSR